MISDKMQKALNAQIGEEMQSAYLYLAMAAYFEDQGFEGMAQWMKTQASEEVGHAMRFFSHIVERGGRVRLGAIAEPKVEWSSPRNAFEEAFKHEQYITGKIHQLVELAGSERDHAAGTMLQWFVTEQVEEEDSTQKIALMLKRIGDSGSGIVMLDRQLGQRKGGGE
jgi:ferritin